MSLTIFGFLVLALGAVLLIRGSTTAMLLFVLAVSLMGGSAAIVLSSLGNSTVPPANLAMIFLVLRCFLPGDGKAAGLERAIGANQFLALFVIYGVVGAFLLPRIFAGAVDVTPLRPNPGPYLLAASPLQFSSQNITVSVYLMSTLLAGICGYVAAERRRAELRVVHAGAIIAIVHAVLGFASVLLAGTSAAQVLGFFRNGFYAQLNQSFGGFVRMNGIWAEPAVFAAYGFVWLVFMTELWLRDIELRWTRPALACIALALIVSTASTAYVGIAGYAVLLLLRQILLPSSVPLRKGLWLIGALLLGAIAIVAILILWPSLAGQLGDLASRTTFDKLDSESGVQRAFWARQGYHAFLASAGLGVGPGSFRSSSLLTAILGSFGVIGTVAFVLHMIRVFRPLRRSTYANQPDRRAAVGAAASWTAAVMLIPASFSAASPDPGLLWGIFCGLALAFRAPGGLFAPGGRLQPAVPQPDMIVSQASARRA
jgi:hypothetical protein